MTSTVKVVDALANLTVGDVVSVATALFHVMQVVIILCAVMMGLFWWRIKKMEGRK